MGSSKARILNKPSTKANYRYAVRNPYRLHPNSEVFWTWNQIKNGDLTPEKLTLMNSGGIINTMRFLMRFEIVANPLHPDNNWRSAVEKLSIGKDIYYRLATEIPISVMEYWKEHGHPPACGWEIFDPNASSPGKASVPEDLEAAPPVKPVSKATPAKKPKPVADKVPAKSIPAESSYKGTPVDTLPRHLKNPFLPGSGYGLLVDILAVVGADGIDKASLLKKYCRLTGKELRLAEFDFPVIASAQRGKTRHKSCREGFFILKQGDIYSIEFE